MFVTGKARIPSNPRGSAIVVCGLAVRGLVPPENLRAVRRTVNPDRDRDEPAMLKPHAYRTGTVYASSPCLTLFRSGALPVRG